MPDVCPLGKCGGGFGRAKPAVLLLQGLRRSTLDFLCEGLMLSGSLPVSYPRLSSCCSRLPPVPSSQSSLLNSGTCSVGILHPFGSHLDCPLLYPPRPRGLPPLLDRGLGDLPRYLGYVALLSYF